MINSISSKTSQALSDLGSLEIMMPDNRVYSISVSTIALDRAKLNAHYFGDSLERSLLEDTIPLFTQDDYAIKQWAKDFLTWEEIASHAAVVRDCPRESEDWEYAWMFNDKKIVKEGESK